MSFIKNRGVGTLALCLACLAGCEGVSPSGLSPSPSPMELFPSPMNFGQTQTQMNLNISAATGSVATWSCETTSSWITIDPTSGTGDGQTTVTVDRNGLAAGEHTADISVVTDLGTETVRVTATVVEGAGLTGTIAFASDRAGNFDIYTMDASDLEKDVTRRTSNDADDVNPTWSHDGLRFAFASNRTGKYQIYVMSPGGTPELLIESTVDDNYPSYSPDGLLMAFLRTEDGAQDPDLYVVDLAVGSVPVKLNNSQNVNFASGMSWNAEELHVGPSKPAWSPDSSKVIVAGYAIVVSQRASGAHEFNVNDPNADIRAVSVNNGIGFSWQSWVAQSPDGARLALACGIRLSISNLTGGIEDPIYETDCDVYAAPDYSSDGRHIAFGPRIDGNRDIYVIDTFRTEGSYLRVRLTDNAADDQTPVWMP